MPPFLEALDIKEMQMLAIAYFETFSVAHDRSFGTISTGMSCCVKKKTDACLPPRAGAYLITCASASGSRNMPMPIYDHMWHILIHSHVHTRIFFWLFEGYKRYRI